MSSVSDTSRLVTSTDLMDLPDDGYRYELVHGSLIRDQAPGFEHSRIAIRLAYHLESWSLGAKTGYVTGEGGFQLRSDPDTVRVPDLAFISLERLPAGKPIGFVEGPPDLAIEIVSPSDRMSGVLDKVSDYFDAGVDQVWVVVPQNRTVMIHRSLRDVIVLNENDTLVGDGPVAGLQLAITNVFG